MDSESIYDEKTLLEKIDVIKKLGNDYFSKKSYTDALSCYSAAIDICNNYYKEYSSKVYILYATLLSNRIVLYLLPNQISLSIAANINSDCKLSLELLNNIEKDNTEIILLTAKLHYNYCRAILLLLELKPPPNVYLTDNTTVYSGALNQVKQCISLLSNSKTNNNKMNILLDSAINLQQKVQKLIDLITTPKHDGKNDSKLMKYIQNFLETYSNCIDENFSLNLDFFQSIQLITSSLLSTSCSSITNNSENILVQHFIRKILIVFLTNSNSLDSDKIYYIIVSLSSSSVFSKLIQEAIDIYELISRLDNITSASLNNKNYLIINSNNIFKLFRIFKYDLCNSETIYVLLSSILNFLTKVRVNTAINNNSLLEYNKLILYNNILYTLSLFFTINSANINENNITNYRMFVLEKLLPYNVFDSDTLIDSNNNDDLKTCNDNDFDDYIIYALTHIIYSKFSEISSNKSDENDDKKKTNLGTVESELFPKITDYIYNLITNESIINDFISLRILKRLLVINVKFGTFIVKTNDNYIFKHLLFLVNSEFSVLSRNALICISYCIFDISLRNNIISNSVHRNYFSLLDDLNFDNKNLQINDIYLYTFSLLMVSKLSIVNDEIRQYLLKNFKIIDFIFNIFIQNKINSQNIVELNEENKKIALNNEFIHSNTNIQSLNRLLVEMLLYFCFHYEIKKFIFENNPNIIKFILELYTIYKNDIIISYHILSFIQQILLSKELMIQKENNINENVEELRNLYDNYVNKQNESNKNVRLNILNRYGADEQVDSFRTVLVLNFHIVNHLYNIICRSKEKLVLNDSIIENVSLVLLKISSSQKIRGNLVNQNIIKLLFFLIDFNKPSSKKSRPNLNANSKAVEYCKTTLSRIFITISPVYIPTEYDMLSIINHILSNVYESTHELHEYESLLALVNISSVDEEYKNYLIKQGAWGIARSAIGENVQLNRVVMELFCNLCTEQSIIDRFSNIENPDSDLQIIILFSCSEDIGTVIASTGSLAMLCQTSDSSNNSNINIFSNIIKFGIIEKIISVFHRFGNNNDVVARLKVIFSCLKNQVKTSNSYYNEFINIINILNK